MTDFGVDYTDINGLKIAIQVLISQVNALKQLDVLTWEEAGFAGIATRTNQGSDQLVTCMHYLHDDLRRVENVLSAVELNTREVDGHLSMIISSRQLSDVLPPQARIDDAGSGKGVYVDKDDFPSNAGEQLKEGLAGEKAHGLAEGESQGIAGQKSQKPFGGQADE
ncbi:hypothetical protein JS530_03105 [Bifidobacterium sp. LC6]|uniref:Uncharacterized protein n=1 Tax=Bifidobacterium colobi TaxID=2809026 RepID=A0ABS5UUU3_9BIFI|nr:hypothetical protein [Bifidobacterium colobi]MBT1174506.1 hypothetical protein [Bifidobacterium colobi]